VVSGNTAAFMPADTSTSTGFGFLSSEPGGPQGCYAKGRLGISIHLLTVGHIAGH